VINFQVFKVFSTLPAEMLETMCYIWNRHFEECFDLAYKKYYNAEYSEGTKLFESLGKKMTRSFVDTLSRPNSKFAHQIKALKEKCHVMHTKSSAKVFVGMARFVYFLLQFK
jgi:hypothetical protein